MKVATGGSSRARFREVRDASLEAAGGSEAGEATLCEALEAALCEALCEALWPVAVAAHLVGLPVPLPLMPSTREEGCSCLQTLPL
jgi:hypothetical protein